MNIAAAHLLWSLKACFSEITFKIAGVMEKCNNICPK